MYFGHEKLEVYQAALSVARWAMKASCGSSLKDQLVRAAQSVVLNVAEGAALPGGDAQKRHFKIALGSAAEVAAAMDMCGGPADVVHTNRRVGQMLGAMTRR